jgi:ribosomal-protein-alanine N-acetyltransferase
MIKGKKIYLRLVREDDLAVLHQLLNDVEAAGAFWPVSLVPEATLRQRFQSNGMWSDEHGELLICAEDDRILGEIMYFATARYMSELEIAYRIFRPEDRGFGATTEALGLLTHFLFNFREINRLRLMIDPDNIGSRRVAEKCGYTLEGTTRGCVFHHAAFHDMDVYAILKLAGPSPHPKMVRVRSSLSRSNMRRYSTKERPQGTMSSSFMVFSGFPGHHQRVTWYR